MVNRLMNMFPMHFIQVHVVFPEIHVVQVNFMQIMFPYNVGMVMVFVYHFLMLIILVNVRFCGV